MSPGHLCWFWSKSQGIFSCHQARVAGLLLSLVLLLVNPGMVTSATRELCLPCLVDLLDLRVVLLVLLFTVDANEVLTFLPVLRC